jgi:hypothetical protein
MSVRNGNERTARTEYNRHRDTSCSERDKRYTPHSEVEATASVEWRCIRAVSTQTDFRLAPSPCFYSIFQLLGDTYVHRMVGANVGADHSRYITYTVHTPFLRRLPLHLTTAAQCLSLHLIPYQRNPDSELRKNRRNTIWFF